MREIVLDTETTGGSEKKGDRIVEIGLVEQIDQVPTGRTFHAYFDPQRDVHWAATKVHGLTRAMLEGQPLFAQKAQEIRDFIGPDKVLAHNSAFDQRFLRSELERAGVEPPDRNQFRDTIRMAERLAPGAPLKLDGLIAHLGIETPDRKRHGALLDTAILAAVVARLRGAPEVDIAMLMEQAVPFPDAGAGTPRGDKRQTRGDAQDAGAKAPRLDAFSEACLELKAAVQGAYDEATSFASFLEGIEKNGVRVRPNLNRRTGDLNGMRFRSDKIYMLSGAFGLGRKHFEGGRLGYDPARDLEIAVARAQAYERDFGPCSAEALPRGHPLPHLGRLTVQERTPAVAADPVGAKESTANLSAREEVRAMITEVNEKLPRINRNLYKKLRCGQDDWSAVSGSRLIARARDLAGESEALVAIHYLADSSRNAALRWVCRGLAPEHALCKTVSEQVKFGPAIPEVPMQLARRLHKAPPEVDGDADGPALA